MTLLIAELSYNENMRAISICFNFHKRMNTIKELFDFGASAGKTPAGCKIVPEKFSPWNYFSFLADE